MILRFGDCRLDTELFELRRAGRVVAMEPQVFDVLVHLATHRDRVVTKEELLDSIWGDRFVSESALTSRLKSARRAVGDDGRNQKIIRTVHGRGYRFVAEAEEGAPAAATTPAHVPSPPGEAEVEEAADRAAGFGKEDSWPLVGRSTELERLARWFEERTMAGVLVTGGPGVGKSRLVSECVVRADLAGLEVERVTGHPETASIPFAAVAHLLPADVTRAHGPEGDLDRTALFHLARASLAERSLDRPLLLVVDDVDHLDDSSRALVSSLVTSASVFALLTQRTDETRMPVLQELLKDGHLRELRLDPLPEALLDVLLHRVLGGPLQRQTLAQLTEASSGNPGMLRQLVEASIEHGSLVADEGVWRLTGPLRTPPSLRALIETRLAACDVEERRALELLALAGQLGLAVATRMTGEEVLDGLDRRGLLRVGTSQRRVDVALAHPLIGEVLRDQLGPLAARRLRSDLITEIEATGARRRDDQLRLVAWWLDTGGDVDPELLLGAARLALVEHDDVLAERLVQRAVATHPSPAAVQLEAELQFRWGHHDRAEHLLSGIDLRTVDAPTVAGIARRRAVNLLLGRWQYQRTMEVLDEAAAVLAESRPVGDQGCAEPAPGTAEGDAGGPDGDRGRAEALLAIESQRLVLHLMLGDVRPLELEGPALLERATGRTRLELLTALALGAAVSGRADDVGGLVAPARELSQSVSQRRSVLTPSLLDFAEVTGLIGLGRLSEAVAKLQHARTVRGRAGDAGWLRIGAARLHLFEGRTAMVRAELDGFVRETQALGQVPTERWLLALVAASRWLEGDRVTAAAEADRVRELLGDEPGLFRSDMDRVIGWVAAGRGGIDAGAECLIAAADDAARLGKRVFEAMLLYDVVRLGRPERVVDRLVQLGASVQGALVAARVAHATALADGDVVRLGAAIDELERIGVIPDALDAATALARLQARLGHDPGPALARCEALSRHHGRRLVGIAPVLED
jgi:DNA-binding winged helix-turn-helix (wHTH) protein